jgi:hypothetical protein
MKEGVICGGGVVSVGVVCFIYACGLGLSGGCQAGCVRDLLVVSLWMRGRLFDVSRVCVHREMAARDIR